MYRIADCLEVLPSDIEGELAAKNVYENAVLLNILVGKDNYNREYIENLIIFYWMDFVISDEMYSTLFEIIEEQHNPKIIEEETPLI